MGYKQTREGAMVSGSFEEPLYSGKTGCLTSARPCCSYVSLVVHVHAHYDGRHVHHEVLAPSLLPLHHAVHVLHSLDLDMARRVASPVDRHVLRSSLDKS